MKAINKLLRWYVRWENRNTFCLFDIQCIKVEYLNGIARKGITLVPAHLHGDKVKLVRVGKNTTTAKVLNLRRVNAKSK